MKKTYLVKKDVTMPTSEDNWIIMNAYEFMEFIKTPEGQSRKANFGRLDACSEEDQIVFVECGKETARVWESDVNRRKYISKTLNELKPVFVDYCSFVSDGECFQAEELLEDTSFDLEDSIIKKLDIELLREALGTLSRVEMELIQALFLSDEPMSLVEYADKKGVSKVAIFKQKERVLKKLRKAMKVEN